MTSSPTPRAIGASPVSLVAIHGNGGGAFRFAQVAERMPPLVRFVAPDLPGFGSASRPTPLPTMRAYGEWVATTVEQLPWPRVLLGHGVGAAFVLEMLQRHADLVDAVILQSPVGAALHRRALPRVLRPRMMRWVAQRALASRVLRPVWRRAFFTAPVPAHIERKFFRNYRQCAAFAPVFDLVSPRWFASLSPVALPAVLLWGARERMLSPRHAEAYRALLPNATTVVEPGWDHFPMVDAPTDYAMCIADLAHQLV